MNFFAKIDNEQRRLSGGALKTKVLKFAHTGGFDACLVAACAPPLHADEFASWLKEGAAGEMHYMKRGEEKRRDPQKVLPGARSIVVLALNYWQGQEPAAAR